MPRYVTPSFHPDGDRLGLSSSYPHTQTSRSIRASTRRLHEDPSRRSMMFPPLPPPARPVNISPSYRPAYGPCSEDVFNNSLQHCARTPSAIVDDVRRPRQYDVQYRFAERSGIENNRRAGDNSDNSARAQVDGTNTFPGTVSSFFSSSSLHPPSKVQHPKKVFSSRHLSVANPSSAQSIISRGQSIRSPPSLSQKELGHRRKELGTSSKVTPRSVGRTKYINGRWIRVQAVTNHRFAISQALHQSPSPSITPEPQKLAVTNSSRHLPFFETSRTPERPSHTTKSSPITTDEPFDPRDELPFIRAAQSLTYSLWAEQHFDILPPEATISFRSPSTESSTGSATAAHLLSGRTMAKVTKSDSTSTATKTVKKPETDEPSKAVEQVIKDSNTASVPSTPAPSSPTKRKRGDDGDEPLAQQPPSKRRYCVKIAISGLESLAAANSILLRGTYALIVDQGLPIDFTADEIPVLVAAVNEQEENVEVASGETGGVEVRGWVVDDGDEEEKEAGTAAGAAGEGEEEEEESEWEYDEAGNLILPSIESGDE